MGEVNLDRLRELAAEIRNALSQLSELTQMEEAAFLKDTRAINSAKYLLIVITEAAIDICNHLSAKKGGRAPQDYSDCFFVLTELASSGRISPGGSQGWRSLGIFLCIFIGRWMIGRSTNILSTTLLMRTSISKRLVFI